MITTQKDLRAAFWSDHPKLKPQYRADKRQNEYLADTRAAWCDYVEFMRRCLSISEALAQRATL